MSTPRPTDRRRRAAAPAAARALDVRPPVSEALAATGVAVPASVRPTAAAGLTPDEGRVHRALVDALAPAEAAPLEALDLAAIDAQLERIHDADQLVAGCNAWGGALAFGTAALVGLIGLAMWAFGEPTIALASAGAAVFAIGMGVAVMRSTSPRVEERAMYLTLRALATDRPALAPVRS